MWITRPLCILWWWTLRSEEVRTRVFSSAAHTAPTGAAAGADRGRFLLVCCPAETWPACCLFLKHTHTHWKINYRTFNNNNTTFILYSAFKSCFLIHSLLQIVSCECTTARVGGARPSTIDAWQCFLLDIPDYIKEWLLCSCCPSLSPSLPFDWTLRCWVCVCCFVLLYFECCVVLCVKKLKKNVAFSSALYIKALHKGKHNNIEQCTVNTTKDKQQIETNQIKTILKKNVLWEVF